jgi:4-hydroxysphinganine ceramide fatty acyl 2-hydroxylase
MQKEIKDSEATYHRVHEKSSREFFVKQHYLVPFAFYLPLAGLLLFKSFVVKRVSILHLFWMLPLISKFWGYLEYFLHQNVLHENEDLKIDPGTIREFHDIHHNFPNDPYRFVVPLWASIPSGLVFYSVCRTALGKEKGETLFGLMVLYYLFYEFIHVAAHKFDIKHPYFEKIKRHHLKHHYLDSDKGFGFTTTHWDEVNGLAFAAPSKKTTKKDKTAKAA